MYDPDITGTGHQPAGFDQMMLSYEHYIVTRARIWATAHNGTSNTSPNFAIAVRAAATPVTVATQLLEDGTIKTSKLTGNNVYGCI